MKKCGMRNAECRITVRASCAPTFRNPQSAIRNALTLVELLVVIVILTTLVGGVIPVLSPNNDTRKIRTAARGLQSYINLVQANAARTGRPHGIAIIESSPESGVALEVYGLEVPPPFAGFSSASAVRIIQQRNTTTNVISYFAHFVLADTGMGILPTNLDSFSITNPPDDYAADSIPPQFLKLGDLIEMGGREFSFTDSNDLIDGVYTSSRSVFQCSFDQTLGSVLAFVIRDISVGTLEYSFTAPKRYKIIRQPITSSEDPYQLPASIVIDMQGSVAEGVVTATAFPTEGSFYTNRTLLAGGIPAFNDTVGMMFSPTGAVSSVLFNGSEIANLSRVVLMLGRIENGGILPTSFNTTNNNSAPWTLQPGEEIEDVQERINWLNLDSRLLSIATRSGRVVVSEPAFVNLDDMGNSLYVTPGGSDDFATADEQLEAAHAFAQEMNSAK